MSAAGAPRVGIYGLLGSGNIGNEGSFDAVLAYLRERHPDAVIDVVCDGPERLTAERGLPSRRLHWNTRENETANSVGLILRKALGKVVDAGRLGAWVRRHDVVIMPGMGVFEATLPLRAWGTPYSQFLVCALGRRFGTRVAFISVGANNVKDPKIRALFVAAGNRAHYLSFRDEYSRGAMRRMGLAERGQRVFPDLVHSLPVPDGDDAPTGVIGLGVLDYHGGNDDRADAGRLHEEYVAGITRIVDVLLDKGLALDLLTGADSDRPVVARVVDHVRRNRPEALDRVRSEPVESVHELMRRMAGVDVVVATRFHNVVCALKSAKPTVSIGYAKKNAEVMATMGLGDYCHRADGFDPDEVCRQVDELRARRVTLGAAMRATSAELRSRLVEQFDLLDEALFPARR